MPWQPNIPGELGCKENLGTPHSNEIRRTVGQPNQSAGGCGKASTPRELMLPFKTAGWAYCLHLNPPKTRRGEKSAYNG